MHPHLLGRALACAILLSHQAQAQGARSSEVELGGALGRAFSAYFEARRSGTGLDAARAALEKSLAEQGAKQGGDPLRHGAQLESALRLALRPVEKRPAKGKVIKESYVGGGFGGEGLSYAYRLPDGYEPARADYPLVIAIPDHGEEPAQHLLESWTDRALREGAIVVSPAMPTDRERWTRVMVSGRPGGLCHVLTVLRVASERFAVDFDRVYVAGKGRGVPAAVAAGNYAPQLFAGVVGRAGDPEDPKTMGPENFTNLPLVFLAGGANARAFHAAALAAGIRGCELDPSGDEAAAWSWMQRHPRLTRPAEVTVVPGDPFPTRAYWLRIAPTAPDARARATIERETNTIRVEAHGVSQLTFYLDDGLVDLERPVRVVAGGSERVLEVRRHLPTLLDLLEEGTSDPACVYVAEAVVDLTAEGQAEAAGLSLAEATALEARLAAAGPELAALWSVHAELVAAGRSAEAEAVLRRIVRLAPEDERARAALAHERAGERWFTSARSLERFRLRQDPERARALGRVEHGGLWLHPALRAQAAKGLAQDQETGLWLGAGERRKLGAGWVLQDHEWLAPEEAPRTDLGLWKVDGEWVELGTANRRHARPEKPWRIPDPEVVVRSTADRAVALRAREEMLAALEDLRRVFGAEPAPPLEVMVLRDEEQYDRFAFGDPDGRRRATHAGRLHSIHSAFFAESWFERVEGKLEHRGMGVCYWDPLIPHGDLYGRHSARLALGLSYVDALDPSPKAVRRALGANGPGADHYAAYQAEKRLPAWLRVGGAVYAERFFRDPQVAEEGDAWWARRWSIENITSRGGWRGLPAVLAFEIEPDRRVDAQKLLIEAGLVVSFLVDGDCEPVSAQHEELKRLLVAGRLEKSHLATLEATLLAHEAELKRFAGL